MKNRSKQIYTSLQTTITLGMITLGILVSIVVAGIFYFSVSRQALDDIKLRLRDIAEIAAFQLKPEELSTITDAADVGEESYIKYQTMLSGMIDASSDVIHIYTMRQSPAGVIYFYLDAGRPDYTPNPPGTTPYKEPSNLLQATFASPAGTVVESDVYTDEFGSVISAYVPIYNKDGSLESILAVDMSADTVIEAKQGVVRKILLYFGLSIPLITLLSWLLGYPFSRHSVVLNEVAARISRLSESNLEEIPITLAGKNKESFDLIRAVNTISGELRRVIETLEQRIAEKTIDLENAKANSERRARQFEAITRINHAIISIHELEVLLPRIAQVVSEQFNVYHTGIFLLDENREFAILHASNSEGGKRMLARGHKLEVSQTGIVGFVTATGRPRIALDVGNDPVHFNNPDLAETRSEAVLPLRYDDRVIGALDVQSAESNAFNEDDMEVLSALADQVSAAISNTLSIQKANKALAEARSVLEKNVQDAWKVMRPKSLGMGYQLIDSAIMPLETGLESEQIREATSKGSAVFYTRKGEPSSFTIPIRLRGQIIGIMHLRSHNREFTNDDADIAQAVSERLSLAIETATLLQSTQHRAEVERLTNNISSKIGASTHFETILQTAAQELSKALGGSDVLVQVEPFSTEKQG